MASAGAWASDRRQDHDLEFLRELVAALAGEAQIQNIVRGLQIHGVEVDCDLAEHDRRRKIDGGGGAIFHDRRTDRPRGIERDGCAIRLGSG